jgi:ribosomal-protein-alanine N-acetyltransferase
MVDGRASRVGAMMRAEPVLETAQFRLVPLAATDGRDLVAHLGDPATVEYMDIEQLADLAGAQAIIAWAAGLLATGQGVRWAIRDHAGAFVGTAGFNALVRERASRGELAYDVVRSRWRHGVMAEVLPALLAYGYGELGLHRIEALVTPFLGSTNAAPRRHAVDCSNEGREAAGRSERNRSVPSQMSAGVGSPRLWAAISSAR